MASTYSPLKLQLMTTGENNTMWGNVTNVNLGTAIEEDITGSEDVTFASTTVTLALTNTNASQTARNLRLNLIGTSGGAQNLIVPAIEKAYIINNGCADAITVKNASGTGIAVPAGKTMWVYNDATNVVNVATHLTSLTLAAALPVLSGGTGVTTSTGSGNTVLSTSPTLTTPLLGTPTSGNLANCTGVSLTTGVSGTLPVANGGTGLTATPTNGFVDIGNGTGFTRAAITAGSGISVTNGAGTITIASTGGGGSVTSVNASGGSTGLSFSGGPITSSGTLTLAGTLAVANGGTGGTTQGTAQSALDVPSRGGSGASGSWGINVTGSSASCTGNAATATNGITTGNISSYAPGLTGSGASGSWGINVTGNAATATTATTATTANALNSANSYTAVDFTATSDTRLKDVYGPIIDALDKVDALSGFYYRNNDKARSLGQVKEDQQVGLSAQDLHEVLPEAVSRWSVDPEYLVVAYDRVIPLLVEAIKELRAEVKALKG